VISFVKHLIVLDLSDCKTSGIHLAISSCASQMILSEFRQIIYFSALHRTRK
jgi:hypothetical protein